ncbi:MAG: 2TM domain-containing protein [Anaerolineae bacterium]|nr:2TM domain-containing protein [Anaerolineae bacterium]
MSDKLRRFLRQASPLIAVQGFLLGLNVLTSSYPWSFFPILAMGIPEFIMFSQIMLGDDDKGKIRQRDAAQAPQMQTMQMPQSNQMPAVNIDPSLNEHVQQARAYQQEIARIAKAANSKTMYGARMSELASQFAGWTKQVEMMSERVSVLRRNPLIKQDSRAVPDAIRKLEAQLAQEKDARIRGQIERTLSARRSQLEALQKLENTTRHAETQLELTIASLGTIYSQTLAGQSTNQIADYSHLASEVDDQVRDLQDQLDALEEVRLGTAQSNLRG